jgi:hypothetical protein
MKQPSARAQTITFPKKFRHPGKLAPLLLTLACLPAAISAGDPPVLSISNAGNTVAVSWSTNSPGYTLQTNGDLVFPGAWADFPVTYNIVGPNYQVTDPIAASEQFYRLKGPGTTFYVDRAGNNANTGLSLAQAWLTPSYALTNAAFTNSFFTNPTTLLFTGGQLFNDTNIVLVGDAIKYPLLIAGSGGSQAVLTNGFEQNGAAGNDWTFSAFNVSQITWSNLCFRGQQSWLATQNASNQNYVNLLINETNLNLLSNLVVTNCRFEYSAFAIELNTFDKTICSNTIIAGCALNSNAMAGIMCNSAIDQQGDDCYTQTNLMAFYVFGCSISNTVGSATVPGWGPGFPLWLLNLSNGVVSGCVLHDYGSQDEAGSPGGAGGIILGDTQSTVVSSNEVYNGRWNGSVDGTGIDFDMHSFNCTAEYNYVHGCDGPGLFMYDSYGGNTFRFNVCISNCNQSANADGAYELDILGGDTSPTNNRFYNNDLIARVKGVAAFGAPSGDLGGSNILVNNILYAANGNVVETANTANLTFASNDYWTGASGGAAGFYWNGTTYSSFAAWTAATGQDPNGFAGDPNWVNGYQAITNYPAQMSGITNWTLKAASSPLLNQATGPYGFANGGIDFLGVDSLGAIFNIGAVNASQ